MSLQVWLPLAGNLENQGLSDIVVSKGSDNNFNNDGKIGKCLSFTNTTKSFVHIPDNNFMNKYINNHDWSICYWVKSTGNGHPVWLSYGLGTSYTNSQISLILYNSGNYQSYSASVNIDTTKWNHLCFTYNVTKNTWSIYCNGELKNSGLYTGGTSYASSWTNGLFLGANPNDLGNTAYHMIGSMNDVRIYDHCLSAKEVKEISKALVLHYPMNDNIQQMDNCYGSILTTHQTWGPTGHQGSASLVNQNQFFSNKTQSYKVSNGSAATANYLVYREVQFSGGYRSFQAIIKEENGKPITNAICYPSWNGYTSGQGVTNNKWTSIQDIGNGYYLCKCEGIYQTTSPSSANSHLVGIYVTKGNSIYISEWWVENNRQTCSHFLNTSPQKVIDCGIANTYDGTIGGKIAVVKDAPRYSNSYQFTTGSDYIKSNFTSTMDELSISFWVKPSSSNGGYSIICSNYNLNGGLWIATNCESCSVWAYRGAYMNVSGSLTNDTWHHCVYTFKKGVSKWYINGEEKTLTKNTYTGTTLPITDLTIGNSYTGTSWNTKRYGNLSDFRLYATALSAEDIAELYHSAVIVDNTGKSYAYEYFEA